MHYMADAELSEMSNKVQACSSHLKKTKLPYVAACLDGMRQSVHQLLDISESQIDPLPRQRVHHVGSIPYESQPRPHISARLPLLSTDFTLADCCRALVALASPQR